MKTHLRHKGDYLTQCGIRTGNLDFSSIPVMVDCKNCLKTLNKQKGVSKMEKELTKSKLTIEQSNLPNTQTFGEIKRGSFFMYQDVLRQKVQNESTLSSRTDRNNAVTLETGLGFNLGDKTKVVVVDLHIKVLLK